MTATLEMLRFNRAHENFGLDYRVLSQSQQAAIDTQIQYDLAEALAFFDETTIK